MLPLIRLSKFPESSSSERIGVAKVRAKHNPASREVWSRIENTGGACHDLKLWK